MLDLIEVELYIFIWKIFLLQQSNENDVQMSECFDELFLIFFISIV